MVGKARRLKGLTLIRKYSCIAMLALGCSVALLAQPVGGKAVYTAGKVHWFLADPEGSDMSYLDYHRTYYDSNGNHHTDLSETWHLDSEINGGLGMCVFHQVVYCFFTTWDKKLQYITVDPVSGSTHGPTVIVSGISAGGAAAAVMGDTLYAFTVSGTFQSADGKHFAANASGAPPGAKFIQDSVTFTPLGADPPGIMVIFLTSDSTASQGLTSAIFSGNSFASLAALPYPYSEWFEGGNLVLGTSGLSSSQGAKDPCIQFYGVRGNTSSGDKPIKHPTRWEYDLRENTWTHHDLSDHVSQNGNPAMTAFVMPWFVTLDSKGSMQLVHQFWINGGSGVEILVSIPSDVMIPQTCDSAYGWDGAPTYTANALGTSDKDLKLRSLWSMIGIVLGTPPYAQNDQDPCGGAAPISQVTYGSSTTAGMKTTQTTTHKLSISSDNTIKAGFAEVSLDLSYSHAWSSAHGSDHSVEVSTTDVFSVCDEAPTVMGKHGWALFSAPIFTTQQYKLFAYDGATYLNQDLYATMFQGTSMMAAYFTLQDPSDGNYNGLLEGLPVYPDSTDYDGWSKVRNWSQGGSDWSATFGPGTVDPLVLGVQRTVSYATSDTTFNTQTDTNSFSVEVGASFDILEGFSSGVTVGSETEYSTETEVTNTLSTSVSCSMNMNIPDCTKPGSDSFVHSMTVQPYWLEAKTNKAPWIPTVYTGNLPWCITWLVEGYGLCAGATAGIAPPPGSSSGTIRLGGEQEKDTYKLAGGNMAWVDAEGIETPIPMTADDFHPSAGASVSLSGHAFLASDANGKWSRAGDVWTFKSGQGAKPDSFTLGLDFASRAWSFDASSKSLDQEIKTADGQVRVQLDVAGMYRFTHWLDHEVKASWSHSEKKATWQSYGVHEIKGEYDSATGVGHVTLKGHVPKNVKAFGDFVIRINGAPVSIPLLSQPGFLEDLDRGRSVKYEAAGLSFDIDFGAGKWKAEIEGETFQAAMAPRRGGVRVQASVGCGWVSDQTLSLQKHTTGLSYGG